MRIWRLAVSSFLVMSTTNLAVPGVLKAQAPEEAAKARVAHILRQTPLIDGHNDWPDELREQEGAGRWTIDLRSGLGDRPVAYNTDIARLRRGLVGGQFWSVYVDSSLPGLVQVERTLEQIDLVKSIVRRYPETFALARTADDVRAIHRSGRIASLIGVEGGGQIDDNLSILRAYRELGAAYLTLTHVKNIDWADSATEAPRHHGLTPFGIAVVRELNRLGMLVDLSHVSEETMRAALAATKAPVIFSHSSARALDDHPRNVSDPVLKLVAANGGVVMVNFANVYISDNYRRWSADEAAERTRLSAPPYIGLYVGQPAAAAAALEKWEKQHPAPRVTLGDVADHIEHIAKVAGVDHVGLGSDFDGVANALPEGMGGVDAYPRLLAELIRRGWSDDAIAKLAGGNVLRVLERAEVVSKSLSGMAPITDTREALDRGIAMP